MKRVAFCLLGLLVSGCPETEQVEVASSTVAETGTEDVAISEETWLFTLSTGNPTIEESFTDNLSDYRYAWYEFSTGDTGIDAYDTGYEGEDQVEARLFRQNDTDGVLLLLGVLLDGTATTNEAGVETWTFVYSTNTSRSVSAEWTDSTNDNASIVQASGSRTDATTWTVELEIDAGSASGSLERTTQTDLACSAPDTWTEGAEAPDGLQPATMCDRAGYAPSYVLDADGDQTWSALNTAAGSECSGDNCSLTYSRTRVSGGGNISGTIVSVQELYPEDE